MPGAQEQTCATCLRLRMFLTIAGGLIAGLYLQPEWATAVAGLMPAPLIIGWGICVGGSLSFWLRFRDYQRQRR